MHSTRKSGDWSGYDDTAEYEYWCKYAKPYGENVLIPMCALGQTDAYMAEHGFNVTAFDYTPEMVEEGNKRFRNVRNFRLLSGDIRSFELKIPPVDFAFLRDLGHLHSLKDVNAAFRQINLHMRKDSMPVIETMLPPAESAEYPEETFYLFSRHIRIRRYGRRAAPVLTGKKNGPIMRKPCTSSMKPAKLRALSIRCPVPSTAGGTKRLKKRKPTDTGNLILHITRLRRFPSGSGFMR
jgi:hypothetical protein